MGLDLTTDRHQLITSQTRYITALGNLCGEKIQIVQTNKSVAERLP